MNAAHYPIVKNRPVAKFFYEGTSHTHPVRRTVVLIESKPSYFRGFELREGSTIRTPGKAPIKSYTKKNIARISDIDKRRVLRTNTPKKEQYKTTLTRHSLADLVRSGV
jgi:hypothetical protein